MNWSQIEERWRRQATTPAAVEAERSLLLGRLPARGGATPNQAKRPFGGWSQATESRSTHATQLSNDRKTDSI
jgi:hypothetical protein